MSILTAPAGLWRGARFPTPWFAVVATLAVAAAVWHGLAFSNADISWLLTVGEHILDGARPYADIVEINPPGSVMLYVPAILLGRMFGVAPEIAVVLLTCLAAIGSLALSAALLRGIAGIDRFLPLLGAGAAALLLLPASSFGQREHIILMTTLPLLASLVNRMAGAPSSPWLRLVGGLVAGIGFAVKPHYALGLVGPLLLLWWSVGWRSVVAASEVWASALVAGTLGLVQILAFPDFTHTILPLLMRIYLPERRGWDDMLLCPSPIPIYAALAVYAGLRRLDLKSIEPEVTRKPVPTLRHRALGTQLIGDTAVLTSLGFFAAYLMQGKGWLYHAYPAIASALIGLVSLACGPRRTNATPAVAAAAAALSIGLVAGLWFNGHEDLRDEAPGLEQAIDAFGPHPKIMSLASDIAIGHPFVRDIGGRWVGTLMSSWISLAIHRLTGRLDLNGPDGADLAFQDRIMARDIVEQRPDAVLAMRDGWTDWLASQPAVARALDDYRVAGTYGPVTLWTRKVP